MALLDNQEGKGLFFGIVWNLFLLEGQLTHSYRLNVCWSLLKQKMLIPGKRADETLPSKH